MIVSVKTNLALRRGRNTLFERKEGGSWGKMNAISQLQTCSSVVRKKNQEKLRNEQYRDRIKTYLAYGLGIVVLVVLGFWLF
ncbi:MAG: hypothetical protein AAFU03_11040 [Bacteroidota bacterium]